MALVCEDLTMADIDTLVRGGHPATTTQLTSTRSGRRIDLASLLAIVCVALPGFQVPAALQPLTKKKAAGIKLGTPGKSQKQIEQIRRLKGGKYQTTPSARR